MKRRAKQMHYTGSTLRYCEMINEYPCNSVSCNFGKIAEGETSDPANGSVNHVYAG